MRGVQVLAELVLRGHGAHQLRHAVAEVVRLQQQQLDDEEANLEGERGAGGN